MGLKEDLELIRKQEAALVFRKFDETTAFELGTLLHERAMRNGWSVIIDIRLFDRQLFFAATAGSSPDNSDWARKKYNIVKHFHKSSYFVGRDLAAKATTLEARNGLSLRDYAAAGGGFPIRTTGAGVIGAVTISGLPQRQDHEVIVETIGGMLGLDPVTLALPPEE